MSIDSLMNTTCDVLSTTTDVSAMGGVGETQTVSLSNEPVRRRQLNGREVAAIGRQMDQAVFRFYFRGGTGIVLTDWVRFPAGSDGDLFDIVDVDDPNGMGKFVQVDAVLRK